MFAFPHPGPGGKQEDDDDHKDGLPLVRLPESSVTLSMLLYVIYPISPSHAPLPYAAQGRGENDGALDTLMEAWLTADKYEVSEREPVTVASTRAHRALADAPAHGAAATAHVRRRILLVFALADPPADDSGTRAPADARRARIARRPHPVRRLVEYHRATLCCSRWTKTT